MQQWQKALAPEPHRIIDSETDHEGNLLVLTVRETGSSDLQKLMLYKLDAAGTELWRADMGSSGSPGLGEEPEVLKIDAANNIYVLVQLEENNYPAGGALAKFSPDGAQLWSSVMEGATARMASVADLLLTEGAVYIAGTGTENNGSHILFRKLNPAGGQVLWEKQYAGASAAKLAADGQHHIVLAGAVSNNNLPYATTDVLLLRYEASNGGLLFAKSYNHTLNSFDAYEVPAALHVTPEGEITVVVPSTMSGATYVFNVALMKTDRDGNEQWHTYMGETNVSGYWDAAFTADGNVVFLGRELKYRQTFDYFLTKYSSSGARIFYNTFNTYTGDTIREVAPGAIALSKAGAIALTGHQALFKAPSSQVAEPEYLEQPTLVSRLYAPDGRKLWEQALETAQEGSTYGRDVVFDATGNLYVTGTAQTPTAASGKPFVIKYSEKTCQTPVDVKLYLPPYAIKAGEQVRTTADFGDFTALIDANVRWRWGDDSTSISYTLPGNPRITGQHRYAEAGIYPISLDFSQSCLQPESEEYGQEMIIFDPAAGNASGAGYFPSPVAPLAMMQEAGTSAYAFAVRYARNDANAKPTGAALLVLNSRHVLFSNSLNWLVIKGNRAALQGTGTVNGRGRYKFVATVEDGKGGGLNDLGDQIRVQVWDLDAYGALVYDNAASTSQRLSLTQQLPGIGGGQVLINHKQLDPLFAQYLQQAQDGNAPLSEIVAYPNPFTSKTTIAFALEQAGDYTVTLYDLKGTLVRQVKQGTATAKANVSVEIDGTSLAQGIYLARLETQQGVQTVKLVLDK